MAIGNLIKRLYKDAKPLEYYWCSQNVVSSLLLPLSWAYVGVSTARRKLYELRNKFLPRLRVPVIVVGNITAGGTGKTPLVIWLANFLKANGYKPGIISRGYGGKARRAQLVNGKSSPKRVGDEPVMIAKRTGCPTAVGRSRNRAARKLLKSSDCDVIISDDGLQHYALVRDIEILVVDGQRRFGNGYCLPAGPLRELPKRAKDVDFVIINGRSKGKEYAMGLTGNTLVNLHDPKVKEPLESFRHQMVNAVAGIGNPERYFNILTANGISVNEHVFADHHPFEANDLDFKDDLTVIMTEKDAVKCKAFAKSNYWYLPISPVPDKTFAVRFINKLRSMNSAKNG